LLQLPGDIGPGRLIAAAVGRVLQPLFPRTNGRFTIAQRYADIAEVIVDLDVLCRLVLDRELERFAGLGKQFLLELQPAQAVQVGAVAVIRLRIVLRVLLAFLQVQLERLLDQLFGFSSRMSWSARM